MVRKGKSDHYHPEAPQPMDGDVARIQMDAMFVGTEGTLAKTDEYGVEVLRILEYAKVLRLRRMVEPSIVEIARRVQVRRDTTTTLAQTSVGGHQRGWSSGTCDWNSAGSVAGVSPGCAKNA